MARPRYLAFHRYALFSQNLWASPKVVRVGDLCNDLPSNPTYLCASNLVGAIVSDKAMQIHIGDVVKLTSGGVKMTVVRIDGSGADCAWSAGSREQTAWVSFACMAKTEKRQFRLFRWLQRVQIPLYNSVAD